MNYKNKKHNAIHKTGFEQGLAKGRKEAIEEVISEMSQILAVGKEIDTKKYLDLYKRRLKSISERKE